MTAQCGNCKANPVDIARNTPGTPTAKLVAILKAHGITSASDLAEIVGISDRAIRKSRNSGSGTQVPPGTTVPELQDRNGTTVPKTELQFRNSGSESSRAHATKESPSEIVIPSKLDSPLAPQSIEKPASATVVAIAEHRSKATPSAKRGSRLDGEWQLPPDWRMWARTNFPAASAEQIDDQAAQFRDYWIAKPGAQACKLDWEATWRNWCRKGLSALGTVRRPQSTGAFVRPKTDWAAVQRLVEEEDARRAARV